MLLLLATLAAAPSALPRCERAQITPAAAPAGKPTIRRLDLMPPARQILGVLHVEDGCPKPIVVHEEVGAPGRP